MYVFRGKSLKMRTEILIFLSLPCCQKELHIYQVSYKKKKTRKGYTFLILLFLVKGISKMANKLGIDYADAVVQKGHIFF